ncbi:MAG: LON peptidase substrate-binding domain-containing protein [Rhodospirillaceae bacterium]|nr:LON peptidase substrate-binding domain-containing protein [Rhodospirillaceae bacterium]MCY4312026.1 LON peptidase substrate-binding domain-containing protein [Rhodospirillaceae bacterium]
MSYPHTIADLPDSLPVFPLQGALLLPRARLPLNIFEPRYMAMVDDALAASRTIGMIQPKVPEQTVPSDNPDLHDLGCAGRITSFEETTDGRYLISLTGLCRFGIREELALKNGYRRVAADYAPWSADFDREDREAINREQLTGALKNYLSARQLGADWDAIDRTPTGDLISIVAMICPFSAMEKQALLRTRALTDRAELIISMLLINSAGTAGTETVN